MRQLKGRWKSFCYFLSLGWSITLTYTAVGGAFHPMIQGLVILGMPGLVLTFLQYPAIKRNSSSDLPVPVIDIICALLSSICCSYVIFRYEYWMVNPVGASTLDFVMSGILLILILEAARRAVGLIMPILTVIVIAYAFCGHVIPGKFGHKFFDYSWILGNLYTSTAGYNGLVTYVVSNVVAIFIIAGAVILNSGAGETFINGANLVAGRIRGGAALASVAASSLFGTVSGSAVANVATTGNFTIPMMRRLGYKPEFAGAVESVASTGGQIMPPIMGAGAFIMAEMLGISYVNVIWAAALPAILYYWGIGTGIYFEASRTNLEKVPSEFIPKLKDILTWSKIGPLFVFVFILMYLLIIGFTPQFSGGLATLLLIGLFISTTGRPRIKNIKERFQNMVDAFVSGARTLTNLTTIILCVQVIIFLISFTGIGIKFSEAIANIAKEHLLIAIILSGFIAMILGMGVPTTAAYVIGITVIGPTLIKLGLNALAVNLFVFYYAIVSVITPPICIAVYIAAGIAKSKWFPTGLTAVRLAGAAYIIPVIFALDNSLIAHGGAAQIILTLILAFIGILFIASGSMGYFIRNANMFERVLFVIGGILLLSINITKFGLLGIGLLAVAAAAQAIFRSRKVHKF